MVGKISDLQSWHYNLLNDIEREKANSYHHSADRARFIIGCVISRLVLGKILSMSPVQVPIDRMCSVCKVQHGRPQLPEGMPQLSVSHSGEWVVVAFTKICTCWHRCRTNESKCRCYENGRRCINRH